MCPERRPLETWRRHRPCTCQPGARVVRLARALPRAGWVHHSLDGVGANCSRVRGTGKSEGARGGDRGERVLPGGPGAPTERKCRRGVAHCGSTAGIRGSVRRAPGAVPRSRRVGRRVVPCKASWGACSSRHICAGPAEEWGGPHTVVQTSALPPVSLSAEIGQRSALTGQ